MDVYRHRRRPRITHISSAKAGSLPVLRDAAERKRTSSPAAGIRFPHRSPFVGKCANDKHITTETSVILRLRTLSVQDIRRRSGRNHEKKELHQFAAAAYPQAGRFLGQNDAARHEQRSCAAHPLGSGTHRMATAMVCSRHRLRRRSHVCWNAARTEWYAAWTHRPKAWNSPDGKPRDMPTGAAWNRPRPTTCLTATGHSMP